MAIMGQLKIGTTTYPVGSSLYGTCDTLGNYPGKVAVIPGFDNSCLITGITVHIKFTNSNSVANPTLAIKSSSSATTTTTAKSIMRYGTTSPSIYDFASWNTGAIVSFTYDGTYWQMNNWLNTDTDTTYTLSADTTNNKIKLTPSSGTPQSITVPYATSAGSLTDSTKLPKSWTTVANSAYNYTETPADNAPWKTVITGNAALKTATEVLVKFTNYRISPIILHEEDISSYVTYFAPTTEYKLCVGALWNKTDGSVSIKCTRNRWRYTDVPVKVDASSIYYR